MNVDQALLLLCGSTLRSQDPEDDDDDDDFEDEEVGACPSFQTTADALR
jgi:hypothetical protein